jgi:hypothetical protein
MKQHKATYTIKVNKSKQTATIRIYYKGYLDHKYRTIKEDKDVINSMEYFTETDIKSYLRNNNTYSVVYYKKKK